MGNEAKIYMYSKHRGPSTGTMEVYAFKKRSRYKVIQQSLLMSLQPGTCDQKENKPVTEQQEKRHQLGRPGLPSAGAMWRVLLVLSCGTFRVYRETGVITIKSTYQVICM
jgi:hypothetical protein